MAIKERKWPLELCELVGGLAVDAERPKSVWEKLTAGELEGWPEPVPMPYNTFTFYMRRERKRRMLAQRRLPPRPKKGTLAQKADRLAHQMIDMSQEQVLAMREAGRFNAGELKDIAAMLQTLRRTAPDGPQPDKHARPERPPAPSDPLELAVLDADVPRNNGSSDSEFFAGA